MVIEAQLKEIAKRLLDEKKVDFIIGYGEGSLPPNTRPIFINNSKDIDKLVFNKFCKNNLCVYLPKFSTRKIGIVVKGCDSRTLVCLIKENQIKKENIFVIGIICEGIVDLRRLKEEGKEELCQWCLSCVYRKPLIFDELIGEEEKVPEVDEFKLVDEFEKRQPKERWEYFVKEFSRCIRCYACVKICPLCYCKECIAQQTVPGWIGITNNLTDIMLFHITRALHLAGRCVDCGNCFYSCPMQINLRLLYKKVQKVVKENFNYIAGVDLNAPLPLATYNPNDMLKIV